MDIMQDQLPLSLKIREAHFGAAADEPSSPSHSQDYPNAGSWNAQLAKLVAEIDEKMEQQQPYQDDILAMQAIQKKNKEFKKTINHYLDMMLVE